MEAILFTPGEPNQRLDITLDTYPLIIESRWVGFDNAHYLDMWEVDRKTPIAFGLKVVLGTFIGRQVRHPFFTSGRVLLAFDRSGEGVDARVDDLGGRIAVLCLNKLDQFMMSTPAPKRPGQ